MVLGRSEQNHLLQIVCLQHQPKEVGEDRRQSGVQRALSHGWRPLFKSYPLPPELPMEVMQYKSNLSPAALVIVLMSLLTSVVQHEIGVNSFSFPVPFLISAQTCVTQASLSHTLAATLHPRLHDRQDSVITPLFPAQPWDLCQWSSVGGQSIS